jgi:hypothetical protein
VVIQARASRCAMAISTSDIISATSAERNRIDAALQRCEIEPFVRGDQIDKARPPARIEHAEVEQYIAVGAGFHRHRGVQIEVPLKHFVSPSSPAHPSAAPVHLLKRPVIPSPFAGLLG